MLIVDDEPNVCVTLKLIFQKDGFVVETARSAAEGISLLNTDRKFDLVLTDIHMEREDAGFELVRVARQLNPSPALIVLTGYGTMHNARTALDIHVDHFVIKPVEVPDLVEAVHRLVRGRPDIERAGH
jgi:YesN/AraC family two-component response regulator